ACEAGKLGLEAATLVARILAGEGIDQRHGGRWDLRGADDAPGDGGTAPSTVGPTRPVASSMGVTVLESAWIQHAEESTLKRLREELRIVERDRSLRPGQCSEPIDDETWQRSRSRRAGQARETLALLTRAVLDAPPHAADTVIRFRLPIDLASPLLSVV